VLPHTKTQGLFSTRHNTIDLPPECNHYVAFHVKLTGSKHRPPTSPYLFPNSDGTRPMNKGLWSSHFGKLQQKHGAPWVDSTGEGSFPLQKLRHIFVADVRGVQAGTDVGEAPGPSQQGASVIMGNSPTAWTRHYDKGRPSRDLAQALQATLARRAYLLKDMEQGDQEEREEEEGEEE
jgi:hypothetical protein